MDNNMFKKPDENNDEFNTRIFEGKFTDISSENFEEEINSENSFKNHPKSKKKLKKHRRMPTIAWISIIIVLSASIATAIIMATVDVMGLTFGTDKTYEFVIPKGSNTEQIADILHEEGVVRYPFLFRVFSKFTHADGSYQYGMYSLKSSSGYSGIVSTLKVAGESGEEVRVTIPEGYSINQIANLMQKKGVCTKSEFISAMKNGTYDFDFIKEIPTEKVYYRLEGYLYPDTYNFYKNTAGKNGEEYAKMAINKMLERMDKVLTSAVRTTAEKKGYTIHEILTMASVVELEANSSPKDMKKVAQVFYNRLRWSDQAKLLGSTPTANYPDSRYNTNSNEGLPPGPLCSPSSVTIDAALNPDTSVKEYYFVTDKSMKFYYTNTYDEHKALIERLKSEGNWS